MNFKILFVISFVISVTQADELEIKYSNQRNELIKDIKQDVEEVSYRIGKKKFDPLVIKAMSEVKRHEFVPNNLQTKAYENRPLPIGYGQTISQPFIVALMSDLLKVKSTDRVLEVGTGSAYQAAVLSKLAKEVYSIEIIPELARSAKARLKRLNFQNVTVHTGDGYYGIKSKAPFDQIMVTAAATHIPKPLVNQLKPGGRMIIPVGQVYQVQHLILLTKDKKNNVTTRALLPVVFVPLTGKH